MMNRLMSLLLTVLVSGLAMPASFAEEASTSVTADVDLTTAAEVTADVNTTPVVVDMGTEGPMATPLSPAQTPMAMPQQSVPTLTSGVEPVQQPEEEQAARPEEYWHLAASSAKLEDYSKRKYKAMAITLTNTTPVHIEVLSGEVVNALSEQQLAHEKAKAKSRRRGFGRFASGMLSAAAYVPGVGGLATMGRGGVIAAQAAGAANYAVTQTSQLDNGNIGITGQYVQRFNQVVLSPNQSFTFSVVLPKEDTPNMRMVFKNLETNQILDLNQPIE